VDDHGGDAMKQVAFADVLLLNKTDLVAADELDHLERRVRRINRAARLHRTRNAEIDLDRILNVGGFNLARAQEVDPRFLEEENEDHHHEHDEEVGSVGITIPGDLDGKKLNDWLSDLLMRYGTDIYRTKGVLSLKNEPRRYVFQGVHMLFDSRADRDWGEAPRENKMIFIGRNLDRKMLTEGFRSCLA
jgi:G3E family GTPase